VLCKDSTTELGRGHMKLRTALASLALSAIAPTSCWAWDATGHEWISGIAIEKLPDNMSANN